MIAGIKTEAENSDLSLHSFHESHCPATPTIPSAPSYLPMTDLLSRFTAALTNRIGSNTSLDRVAWRRCISPKISNTNAKLRSRSRVAQRRGRRRGVGGAGERCDWAARRVVFRRLPILPTRDTRVGCDRGRRTIPSRQTSDRTCGTTGDAGDELGAEVGGIAAMDLRLSRRVAQRRADA